MNTLSYVITKIGFFLRTLLLVTDGLNIYPVYIKKFNVFLINK